MEKLIFFEKKLKIKIIAHTHTKKKSCEKNKVQKNI